MSANRSTFLDATYRGVERSQLARLMRRYRNMIDILPKYGAVNTLKTFWLRRYSYCYIEVKRRQGIRRRERQLKST